MKLVTVALVGWHHRNLPRPRDRVAAALEEQIRRALLLGPPSAAKAQEPQPQPRVVGLKAFGSTALKSYFPEF